MIVYCGLRHFYIRHFQPPHYADSQTGAYYILTHNKEIWDFSPELKGYGFTNQAKGQAALHLDKPVLTIPIEVNDFASFARGWHGFSHQYTDELEVEYPHAWYLRFKQPAIFSQFITDFSEELQHEREGGIWGAGQSKLVAKLAAHNLTGHDRVVIPGQTKHFLGQIPLHRFPLPELADLEKLGIKTIGELENVPGVELSNQFGQRAAILQKLGRGEDLVPFQSEPTREYSWTLDCTSLDGFLRPLAPHELRPYLKQGMEKLASTLKDQHKVTGQIKIEAQLDQGEKRGFFEKKRQFKESTDDPKILTRAVESLLPESSLAQVNVIASKLGASPLAQLTMFWEPQTPKLNGEELSVQAQIGIELSRRERLLILWKECFM